MWTGFNPDKEKREDVKKKLTIIEQRSKMNLLYGDF